jgi:hypothetical protein
MWKIPSHHSYLNHFEKTSTLNGYFALPLPNYLIVGYVYPSLFTTSNI